MEFELWVLASVRTVLQFLVLLSFLVMHEPQQRFSRGIGAQIVAEEARSTIEIRMRTIVDRAESA